MNNNQLRMCIALFIGMLLLAAAASTVSAAVVTSQKNANFSVDKDSHIEEQWKDTNYGSVNVMHVTTDSPAKNERTFVQANFTSIPSGSVVLSAVLKLHMEDAPGASRTYKAYGITSSWNESGLTWRNQPSVNSFALTNTSTGTSDDVWLSWNLSSSVQSFVNGSVNNGWEIRDSFENSSSKREAEFRSSEASVDRPYVSVIYTCDYDNDGYNRTGGCGGADCNDYNSSRGPAVAETCNGQDDDCDGQIDEGGVCPTTSYSCDSDSDGYVSAAVSATCNTYNCLPAGCSASAGNDCNDANSAVHPGADDSICNGVDDDCNGAADEGYVSVPTQCGVGACAANGEMTCSAGSELDTCEAGLPADTDSSCDNIDDNCNGAVDESYANTPTQCGVGACAANGEMTCSAGSEVDTCVSGMPAETDATCNNLDDNCNGATDEDYEQTITSCGIGACASTGTLACSAGSEIDSCLAGLPEPDSDCDNVDDNCNGVADDEYQPTTISCGVGACASSGLITCSGGERTDGCIQGTPAETDATCNGVDDNCDGAADEGYVNVPTQCGVGACAANGEMTCSAGSEVDTCEAGLPADTDSSCNNVDDDCNGATDEGYQQTTTACGVGACASLGTLSCSAGSEADSCVSGVPAESDSNCDNVDDNCNGVVDEDYVNTPTYCGTGVCAASGSMLCLEGTVVDSCVTGQSTGDDVDCNGLDDNCNGLADEGYQQTTTACGVGACASAGTLSCGAGAETDSCQAGVPAETDSNCNNVDDNCNGATDEGYQQTTTTCGIGACGNNGILTCSGGQESNSCEPGQPQPETCDGIDNNCDEATDEGGICPVNAYYCDSDSDSFYSATPSGTCDTYGCVPEGCYTEQGNDCNDESSDVYPGADDSACNGVDNNCDGSVDEGYISTPTSCGINVCSASGLLVCADGQVVDTCTPGQPTGGDNDCNAIDENCDGIADNKYIIPQTSCGVGACARIGEKTCAEGQLSNSCVAGPPTGTDNDCNGIDENCDGIADNNFEPSAIRCGVGACAASGFFTCSNGQTQDSCTPNEPQPEICDGLDNNCDGQVDEGEICSTVTYYCDSDEDGYRSAVASGTCYAFNCVPAGCSTETGNDCDDKASSIHPNATELCNGIDENCNDQADEGVLNTYYYDNDGDGFGSPSQTVTGCSAQEGYVTDGTDYIIGISEDVQGSGVNFSVNQTPDMGTYSGIGHVVFMQGGKVVLEFDYNFTNETVLDLGQANITGEEGKIIIKGINLSLQGLTKTAYVDAVGDANTACVVDAEVDTITVVGDCTNGVKVPCDGSVYSGYTCTASGSRLKITGLKHSAVAGYYNAPAAPPAPPVGGGGGGGSSFVCVPAWTCQKWTDCGSDSLQRCLNWTDTNACGRTYTGPMLGACAYAPAVPVASINTSGNQTANLTAVLPPIETAPPLAEEQPPAGNAGFGWAWLLVIPLAAIMYAVYRKSKR